MDLDRVGWLRSMEKNGAGEKDMMCRCCEETYGRVVRKGRMG